jgi:hypothetical protein
VPRDCHVDLVRSFEEAQVAAVKVWESVGQVNQKHILDEILTALDAEGICLHGRKVSRW